MVNRTKEMKVWGQLLNDYRLPRWKDLPDIDLYKEQVISLVEQYVDIIPGDEKLLTPAMINNYVKLGVVPPPKGKRYQKMHLAYFLAITIFKQVLTVSEISNGLKLQQRLTHTEKAYDIFCDEIEYAFQIVAAQTKIVEPKSAFAHQVSRENLTMRMVCFSVATKLYTQKILSIPMFLSSEEKKKTTAR